MLKIYSHVEGYAIILIVIKILQYNLKLANSDISNTELNFVGVYIGFESYFYKTGHDPAK